MSNCVDNVGSRKGPKVENLTEEASQPQALPTWSSCRGAGNHSKWHTLRTYYVSCAMAFTCMISFHLPNNLSRSPQVYKSRHEVQGN